ncbi:MAG TPA: quinone-dependent dihydroorotate dehydrogenase [Steroidobacteraceae bacterium]|nr:quinone-dependent dihydroorotate dehydrogenase [Steroidobacteraceae bacterium]
MYRLLRPLLFRLDPERAQSVALAALSVRHRLGLARDRAPGTGAVELFGLRFTNRIGLAAGFDKSARHIDALGELGFGFIEVGTVTPRAQPGNPAPNLFRLVEDGALINRMGFNNEGVEQVARRLEARRYRGICGVNIGKNADTPIEQSSRDYVECLRAVYGTADYVTVNISSPNTRGLRSLQGAAELPALLAELSEAREQLQSSHAGKRLPLLLKLSPDLSAADLDRIAPQLLASAFDGVLATNTTIGRPAFLRSRFAAEEGGLSGRPLQPLSLATIAGLRARLGAQYPIIGIGGISSVAHAQAAIGAGADLLQVYTGLVYEGPGLIKRLRRSGLWT